MKTLNEKIFNKLNNDGLILIIGHLLELEKLF